MTDTLIYCFTGTGNSLQAAKEIKEIVGNAEIKPVLSQKTEAPTKYKRIGFVFPVYFWGLPLQVYEFLKNLDLGDNKDTYFFAVVTCGAMKGNSAAMINTLLQEKGSVLHYAKSIKMPDSYLPSNEAKALTEKDKNRYAQSITEIANAVSANKTIHTGKENMLITFFHNKFRKDIPNADKNFIVENCTGCGTCVAVCPAKNITVNNKAPEFHHHCEQCMACIQYCPAGAINYRQKTSSKKRYHNPHVSLQERMGFYAVTGEELRDSGRHI
jgi:ferredoxin